MARYTGGTSRSTDVPGAPDRTPDFAVDLSDGRVLAVEVTRHTDPVQVQRDAEVARREWRFPVLRHWWVLSVGPVVHVDALHAESGHLLSILEASGIDRDRFARITTSRSLQTRRPVPCAAFRAMACTLSSLSAVTELRVVR